MTPTTLAGRSAYADGSVHQCSLLTSKRMPLHDTRTHQDSASMCIILRMREIAIAPGRWGESSPAPKHAKLRLNFAQGAAAHLGGSCDRMMIPIGCLSTSTAKAGRRADHTSEGCAVVLGNSTLDNPCATRRGESLSVIEVGRPRHAVCEAAALTVILLITTLIELTLCGRCSSGHTCCATPSNAGGHFGPISVQRDRGATRARSKPEHIRA
jgi:hypothetical protein